MVNCMYVNVWLIYAFSNTGCKMYNKYKDLLKKTWLWVLFGARALNYFYFFFSVNDKTNICIYEFPEH